MIDMLIVACVLAVVWGWMLFFNTELDRLGLKGTFSQTMAEWAQPDGFLHWTEDMVRDHIEDALKQDFQTVSTEFKQKERELESDVISIYDTAEEAVVGFAKEAFGEAKTLYNDVASGITTAYNDVATEVSKVESAVTGEFDKGLAEAKIIVHKIRSTFQDVENDVERVLKVF